MQHKEWTWLHYDKAEGHVICLICKNANDHGILNNIKVEDSFVKTWNSDWKNARSTSGTIYNFHLECPVFMNESSTLTLFKIPWSLTLLQMRQSTYDKGFQKQKSLTCHQTALQRLLEVPKTTQDVSTKLKNNVT